MVILNAGPNQHNKLRKRKSKTRTRLNRIESNDYYYSSNHDLKIEKISLIVSFIFIFCSIILIALIMKFLFDLTK
mgnify:CR=1 FL=1